MPRGYLKNFKQVNRKSSRGGNSYRSGQQKKTEKRDTNYCKHNQHKEFSMKSRSMLLEDDFTLRSSQQTVVREQDTKMNVCNQAAVAECLICFNIRTVVHLSQACQWHEAACQSCIRSLYKMDSKEEIKEYPFTCFHPQCQRPLYEKDLKDHHVFRSTEESEHFHEKVISARKAKREKLNRPRREKHEKLVFEHKQQRLEKHKAWNRAKGLRTLICPTCEFPRGVGDLFDDEIHKCQKCRQSYIVSPNVATLLALERIDEDTCGRNDGWGKCPECNILISKGDGTSDVICGYCHVEFNWTDIIHPPLARPPYDELYLWW